eukprot:1146340-Pelagomonas_calceolata.AAC.4
MHACLQSPDEVQCVMNAAMYAYLINSGQGVAGGQGSLAHPPTSAAPFSFSQQGRLLQEVWEGDAPPLVCKFVAHRRGISRVRRVLIAASCFISPHSSWGQDLRLQSPLFGFACKARNIEAICIITKQGSVNMCTILLGPRACYL